MIYIMIACYLFFTVTGLLLIKIGGKDFFILTESSKLVIQASWKFIIGFISYVISFIIWTVLLQKFNLSYMYPILVGAAYIFIMLASFYILKEKISLINIIGSGVILIGILLMVIKK